MQENSETQRFFFCPRMARGYDPERDVLRISVERTGEALGVVMEGDPSAPAFPGRFGEAG